MSIRNSNTGYNSIILLLLVACRSDIPHNNGRMKRNHCKHENETGQEAMLLAWLELDLYSWIANDIFNSINKSRSRSKYLFIMK